MSNEKTGRAKDSGPTLTLSPKEALMMEDLRADESPQTTLCTPLSLGEARALVGELRLNFGPGEGGYDYLLAAAQFQAAGSSALLKKYLHAIYICTQEEMINFLNRAHSQIEHLSTHQRHEQLQRKRGEENIILENALRTAGHS